MCLQRPSYNTFKHFKIQLKYLLKLNERLVELLFDHSYIMPEQMYITDMNLVKECQDGWTKVKDVVWGLDKYKYNMVLSSFGISLEEGLDYLEEDITISELHQLGIIEELKKRRKKKTLK